MKAIIGTAVGILGLGGLVVASSSRPAEQTSLAAGDRAAITSGATVVDCGEGRQAFVHPSTSGPARVECVPVAAPQAMTVGLPYAPYASQLQPTQAPVQQVPTIVQERVVYRERPAAARTTSSRRTSRASSSPAVYTQPAPVYREDVKQGRSWKKSAVIIGGATAGGAGVGAVLGGKSGAKKGAVVGLIGGTVYDIATRNK